MTLAEKAKELAGLADHHAAPTGRMHIPSAPPNASSQADETAKLAAATHQQMSDAKLPLAYRDSCAHLLIPLNRCRFEMYYLPWKCEDERHSYEKCQYVEFKKRVAKMDELKAARQGERIGN